MTRSPRNLDFRSLAGLALAVVWTIAAHAADVRPNPELARKASWQVPTAQSVREQALGWLTTRELDEADRKQLEMLWASGDEQAAGHLLDLLCATFAGADPQAKALAAVCSRPKQEARLPDVAWLADEKTAALERDNLRLFYGRWLVQESLFDEAAEQLGELKPEQVVEPAALLFYQAIVAQRTLNRDKGLAAISRLLENESELPRRYVSLAKLLQADLEALKDESLDHIARRMDDIRRRLDLGRAGPKVREVEDGVIASLDKLIEEMEKQQQAAAAAAAASGRGSIRSTQPAQDSVPIGGKGQGEVTKKPIGGSAGWGDLPPRQRQEALQQIGKDFPAHYRDMIEQYFRKLASESEDASDK